MIFQKYKELFESYFGSPIATNGLLYSFYQLGWNFIILANSKTFLIQNKKKICKIN